MDSNMRARGTILIVALVATLSACDESESELSSQDSEARRRNRCSQLREHLVDTRLSNVTVDRDQHRRALTNALGDQFIDECLGYSEAAVECGVAAQDSEAVADCLAEGTEE
jgi:hypothetical protein